MLSLNISKSTQLSAQPEPDVQAPDQPAATVDPKIKKRNDGFRQKIDTCKAYRRKLISNWATSIDFRRGKPFTSQSDDDQISVNLDWSLTKAKQAALFSQVPQVRVDHPPQTTQIPWVASFERSLNDALRAAGIEAALDECLPDCINAAGIGVVLVAYEAIMEDKEVPAIDISVLPPELQKQVLQTNQLNGVAIPTQVVPTPVDHRYVVQRVSPADLLWEVDFSSSNFDVSPWIGRSGKLNWAEAAQKWRLSEEEKDSVLGEDNPTVDKLNYDVDREKSSDDKVGFDEVFFREFQYDPAAKSFSTIHHLVFVNGKDEPVVDEPWKGQRLGEQGFTGSKKFPIRVLTLAYITDETIPPSDSAIGRPQVNELNKARTQMIKQRERSLPVRWFDVNRVDPMIQTGLMRGTWQAMIPVQGEGSRIIGEVARATMPPENFLFDKIAKADLYTGWTVSPVPTEDGEEDPTTTETAFKTRIGRERAKVASFFVGIAEVLGSLMCLYEDPSLFGEGFDPAFSSSLSYSILADSTVLLDSNQRLKRLNDYVNMYGKTGYLDLESVMKEAATLAGIDPSAIKKPEPKPPVEPNISLRLTGVEDMLNPLALAFLIKSGQAPTSELIEQAKSLIQQAVVPPTPPPGMPPTDPNAPQPPGAPLPPPGAAPPPGTPLPSPPPPQVGEANPQWTTLPKLDKRSESGGKQ